MTLSSDRFGEFYEAVYGYEAFPWQQMLAERVIADGWPECIDLPTASGKTACIDIAVFALACQADRPPAERTAPRRIFFVVDRRIIVDAAFERATKLAKALRRASDGVRKEVADRLRALHDGDEPLAVARIRGGIARNDGWVRSPAQPAVITGTVDQVGSRLLFRAYGPGQLSAPIHAALVGNDSLIVLDEAHCAIPFFQTAKAVERYRGAEWAEELLPSPFRVVVMSATPPAEVTGVFPEKTERAVALDHPKLDERISSAKSAELAIATRPKKPKRGAAGLRADTETEDELVLDAADRAVRLAAEGRRRIAIMVNRVATARAIHAQLLAEREGADERLNVDVVLMTGRMRPLDRDDLVETWAAQLQARDPQPELDRPIILVTTQCLEVGADFSFDALITECASLDALRQRFGRLDRLGTVPNPRAAVLIRKSQLKDEDDPIYGGALAATWEWLNERGVEKDNLREFDFGIAAMDSLLPSDREERRVMLKPFLAPAPDAPVMLPAHVDCWSQTAPVPRPDPDVAVFLHGPARGAPDVYVVLRADLDVDRPDTWLETVSLCPPSSLEAFPVPIHVLRRWMAGRAPDMESVGDVEGAALPQEDEPDRGRRQVVVWRGRTKSGLTRQPDDVRPYDVVLVPARADGLDVFGDVPAGPSGARVLDLGDRAFLQARARPMLRLTRAVLQPWADHPAVAKLLSWAENEEHEGEEGELHELLEALAEAAEPAVPDWMRRTAEALVAYPKQREVIRSPAGGYVLTSWRPLRASAKTEEEVSADEDDLTSDAPGPVPLREHLEAVAATARDFARRCLPENKRNAVARAAQLHDIGKADWRFQIMLHRGNELEAFRQKELLAKSAEVPRSAAAHRRARQLAQLPDGFRHEMVSVQATESVSELLEGLDPDLVLHLIASHHGHGRPFAPVVPDDDPPDLEVKALGVSRTLTTEQRRALVPPHRLDSGVPERFWRLTRRYGWWGLAYLEAILRLADWEASDRHEEAMVRAQAAGAEEVA